MHRHLGGATIPRAPRALMKKQIWNEISARKMVRQLVNRKALLFAGLRGEFGAEDLEQEGVVAAHADWPRFNPRKSHASTFIYMVASRRLLSEPVGRQCQRWGRYVSLTETTGVKSS